MRMWYKKGQQLLNEIETTSTNCDEIAIWYIGQCGFVIKNKVIIYIDPVLNDINGDNGESIRKYEVPFEPEEAYADYVLITHEHIDHMAENTVKGMFKKNNLIKFIIPGLCKEIIKSWDIPEENIIEMKTNTEKILEGFSVKGISTAHPNHKCNSLGQEYSLAYYICINDVHILHLGDTLITDRLMKELNYAGHPDIFMVPINGSDYFKTKNQIIGNLSYDEAVSLSSELKADLTIPMHFDMIEGNTVNPMYFFNEFMERFPNGKFKIPALGERIIYKSR